MGDDTINAMKQEMKTGQESSVARNVIIYGIGMLLLYLTTGQEKKTAMDAGIKNPTLKSLINRCTALDSRRRFQSLTEVRAVLNRELVFPRRRMKVNWQANST